MLVEGGGRLVDRIDHHGNAHRHELTRGGSPRKCVEQEVTPDTAPLKGPMQRQAGKQDRRDRLRRTVPDLGWECCSQNQMRRKAEVRDNIVIAAVPHERPSGPVRLCVPSVFVQPLIEPCLSRVEPI